MARLCSALASSPRASASAARPDRAPPGRSAGPSPHQEARPYGRTGPRRLKLTDDAFTDGHPVAMAPRSPAPSSPSTSTTTSSSKGRAPGGDRSAHLPGRARSGRVGACARPSQLASAEQDLAIARTSYPARLAEAKAAAEPPGPITPRRRRTSGGSSSAGGPPVSRPATMPWTPRTPRGRSSTRRAPRSRRPTMSVPRSRRGGAGVRAQGGRGQARRRSSGPK